MNIRQYMQTASATDQCSHEEEDVCWAFSHPTGQVRIPGFAIRDIDTYFMAQVHKLGLAVSTNPVEHLDLPGLTSMCR